MLEDGAGSSTDRHQVEPLPSNKLASETGNVGSSGCLHDNQVDKVDGTSHVQLRVIIVRVDVRGQFSELEPEVGKWDSVSLQIPKGHGK